jgi:hypothetical protein
MAVILKAAVGILKAAAKIFESLPYNESFELKVVFCIDIASLKLQLW